MANIERICTKFDRATYEHGLQSNVLSDKIQNGGRRHIEIHIFAHNSVTVARNFAHTQNECVSLSPNFSVKSLTHLRKSSCDIITFLKVFSETTTTTTISPHNWLTSRGYQKISRENYSWLAVFHLQNCSLITYKTLKTGQPVYLRDSVSYTHLTLPTKRIV